MCSPKQGGAADHKYYMICTGGLNHSVRVKLFLSSQAARNPMFQFEFQGLLFQLEAREPELAPFVRVPLLSAFTLVRLRLNPSAQHVARLSQMYSCHFCLMLAHELAFWICQKAHHVPQIG